MGSQKSWRPKTLSMLANPRLKPGSMRSARVDASPSFHNWVSCRIVVLSFEELSIRFRSRISLAIPMSVWTKCLGDDMSLNNKSYRRTNGDIVPAGIVGRHLGLNVFRRIYKQPLAFKPPSRPKSKQSSAEFSGRTFSSV
jgi:hypothetical protein